MKQLTREQALAFHDSKVWEQWSSEEIVKLQLFQDLLCVPFEVYHKAITEVLDRDVFTHEFAFPESLIQEYFGTKPKPTLDDVLNLIPEEKRLIIKL